MYNIHSHYENIFSYLKTKFEYPVLMHFYPFGSISYNNLEKMHNYAPDNATIPIFLCYDQEPLTENVVQIIDQLRKNWGRGRYTIILLNTESKSQIKNLILEDKHVLDCYYFFHIFAAADWYRGYQYCHSITNPNRRSIRKKYITFNRITGNSRAYRSIFISKLAEKKLIEFGHISYSHICPEHGHYSKSLYDLEIKHKVNKQILDTTKEMLDSINFPLRIDNKESEFILNGSQTIDALSELMESFLHVVTETCFWESKTHLTEKIFKPIVCKQPFLLLGCANNLKYLRSYGFKTFNRWWDESYDSIEDPIQRINAVVKIIEDMCNMPNSDLENMLNDMNHVLEYNYNLFYSQKFISSAWEELKLNVDNAYAAFLQVPQIVLKN